MTQILVQYIIITASFYMEGIDFEGEFHSLI